MSKTLFQELIGNIEAGRLGFVEQTPIQYFIECRVTNGLGVVETEYDSYERAEDTNESLAICLASMDETCRILESKARRYTNAGR